MILQLWAALVVGALGTRVQPEVMTFGKDAQAQLEVLVTGEGGAPLPDARVTGSASVGTVLPARALGGGRFRLTFLPPKERFPQVALILVQLESGARREHAWVRIPLLARASLKLSTKPHATVTVALGAQSLGPVKTDRRGFATVAAVVPPGFPSAVVNAVDEAGNASTKPLDLEPRPFPLVRTFMPEGRASWADPEPLPVELFAIDTTGKPLQDPSLLHVKAATGQVTAPVAKGGGVFLVRYRAPDHVGSGKDTLEVSVASAPPEKPIAIDVRPGPPTRLAVQLEPAAFVAGTGQVIQARAVAQDARGNSLHDLTASLVASLGRLVMASGRATLELPDAFDGRRSVTVRATAGGLSGEATLPLQGGPPSKAQLSMRKGLLKAGRPLDGALTLTDRFGNPTEHAHVRVLASDGTEAQVEELGGGQYHVRYQPPDSAPAGEIGFEVRSGDTSLESTSGGLTLLPSHPWGVSLGLYGVAQSNLSRATAGGPRLAFSLGLGRSDFELLAEGDLPYYASFQENLYGAGAPIAGTISRASSLGVGLRYAVPVAPRIALFGSLLLGEESVTSSLRYTTAAGAPQTASMVTPLFRAAGGASFWLGPGRLLAQLELSQASAKGQLMGNLGGLGLGVGYLFML